MNILQQIAGLLGVKLTKVHENTVANKKAIEAEVTRAKASETLLDTNIKNETKRAQDEEARIELKAVDLVTKEETRAIAAEKTLTNNLNAEVTRATKAESDLRTKIDTDVKAEADRAKSAEATLDTKINTEKTRAEAAEKTLTDNLSAEVTRATKAEKTNSDAISAMDKAYKDADTTLQDNINAEVTRAKAAEKVNADAITAVDSAYKAADTVLKGQIDTEVTRATSAEGVLNTKIDTEVKKESDRAHKAETELNTKVDTEVTRAKTEETRIETKAENLVKAEKERATTAEKANTDAITALDAAYKAADTSLSNRITTEVNDRKAADTALDNKKVDKVQGKQLSTEDYTTAEKTKLSNIDTYVTTIGLTQSSDSTIGIVYGKKSPSAGSTSSSSVIFPVATSTKNGLITPAQKTVLDNLISGSSALSTLGTPSQTWQLSLGSGPKLKNSSGTFELRNAADTAYADLTVNALTIKGNVTQEGGSFITQAETVSAKDNTILLNSGEKGAGVTKGVAGVEIDRGTLPKYEFIFDESDDRFKVGSEGDLWSVMLRDNESDLTDGGILTWNKATKRAKTAFNINDLASTYLPLAGGKMTGTLGIDSKTSNIAFTQGNESIATIGTTLESSGVYNLNISAVQEGSKMILTASGGLFHKTKSSEYKIWTSGNDGASSGLDADLLDGQQGSYYAKAADLNNYLPLSAGSTKPITGMLCVTGYDDSFPYNGTTTNIVAGSTQDSDSGILCINKGGVFGIGRSMQGDQNWSCFYAGTSPDNTEICATIDTKNNWNIWGSLAIDGEITKYGGAVVATTEDINKLLPLSAGASKPLTGVLYASGLGGEMRGINIIGGSASSLGSGIEFVSKNGVIGIGMDSSEGAAIWVGSSQDDTHVCATIDNSDRWTFPNGVIFHGSMGATIEDLTGYLPLEGGTMDGNIVLPYGKYIIEPSGNQWTLLGMSDATTTLVGPRMGTTRVRSGNTNLLHDKNGTAHIIWDASNDGAGSGLDADLLDGKQGSAYALATSLNSYLPLAGGTLTGKLIASKGINLNNVGKDGISFYSTSYVTWVEYMTSSGAGNASTGGTASSFGDVNSYARRSTIESSSGYGWIWDSCANTSGANPNPKMALSSSTGNLKVKGIVTAPTFSGALSGNASTATTLQTTRNLTIGNTAKSFNGSANVSWSLAEIGAAAASHTHAYLPLAGGTMTGNITLNSAVILQKQNETSNYTTVIKWMPGNNPGAQIGCHNTGGDGTGSIVLVPYNTDEKPWEGGVGLFISKNKVKIDGVELAKKTEIPTTMAWGSISGIPTTASRWPTWVEVTNKPVNTSYSFGGNTNSITTAQFVTMLNTLGAFRDGWGSYRGSWSYAGNQVITDTGVGNIHLAGCWVEICGNTSNYTIRVTVPTTTSAGTTKRVYVYCYNGTDYSPGWFAVANTYDLTWDKITGKPSFATVATSGSYNDLSNKPTIPSLSGYAKSVQSGGTTYSPNSSGVIDMSGEIFSAKISRIAKTFLAAPTSANGVANFRTIVADDLPTIPYSKISGTPSSLPANGGNATTVGDGTIKLYANNSNEINFGGTNTTPEIHFGYTAKDSRPLPTVYHFGKGKASIMAGSIYSNGNQVATINQIPSIPSLSGGAAATSGQYVSGVTVSGHAVTVTKATLPSIPSSLKNPYAITFTGGVTGTYDGSAAKTVAIPTTLPANGGYANELRGAYYASGGPEKPTFFNKTGLFLRMLGSGNLGVAGTYTDTLIINTYINDVPWCNALAFAKDGTARGWIVAQNPNNADWGTKKQIVTSDMLPTSLPASDVYSWAKASTKPSYAWSEITGKPTIPSIPSLSGGAAATSGQYVSGVTVSGHTVTVTKAALPAIPSLTGYATQAWVTQQGYLNSVPTASASVLGGIKIGYPASGKTYPVVLNSSNQAYVSVPWTDTNTNYYLSAWAWANGTTSGPTASATRAGTTALSIPAIPVASASYSGVVTTGAQTFAGAKTFSSFVTCSAGAGTSSDIRLKKNISKIVDAEEILSKLSGYRYIMKDTQRAYAGLIAQEVQEVLPEAVREDENGFLTVDTYPIVAALVEANKAKSERIEELENRLSILEEKMNIILNKL